MKSHRTICFFTLRQGENQFPTKISILLFLAPSELQKWRCRSVCRSVGRSVCRSVCRSVGGHLAFQQHLVHVAALSSLVQSGLDQCRPIQSTLVKSSQIQSNLVKSRQIQSNLEKSFLGYFWQHIAHVVALYSLVQSSIDQWVIVTKM